MGEKSRAFDTGKSQTKYALAAFLAIVLFVIIYKYTLNELGSLELNDLQEHTAHAEDIYLDRLWSAWLKLPYLFWHLCVKGCIKFLVMPVEEAAAFVCGGFALLNYYATFYLLDRTVSKLTGRDAGLMSGAAAGMLGLVQPLYMRWFNPFQYEGQFSINPMFNPTHSAVKPIGLLCFMAAVDLILRYKEKDGLYFSGIRKVKWLYALFAVLLLFSAFTKPTFMFMLLPAGALYLLAELAVSLCRKDGDAKKVWGFMWRMACAAMPSLLYLLIEYGAFYLWGGKESGTHVAIYPFLEAWRLYSPSVPKSVVLSMAFPIWMVATNWRYFVDSVEGRLSAVCYAAGTLEFCFVVETGGRLEHLNFAWCMMSGMLLIWAICAARLVAITVSCKPGKWQGLKVTFGWMLLALHLFSGLYYISPAQYII